MNRSLKDYSLLVLKGMGMGAADVVPGVSGGTIAFIVGIYEELLDSIKSINAQSLKLLFTGKLAEFWKAINANFLVSIVLGIAISIFSLAKLITYLLEFHPILVWAFFFGLVLASSWFVAKTISKWDVKTIVSCIAGIAIAYYVTVATPAETPTNLPFIFLCGAVAICAMILPGISGSFILVLMGKYFYIMDAVKSLNIIVMLVFICGAGIGITMFSRVLSYALKKFHNVTIAALAGFMIGSLNKVWPWKQVLETYTDSHGKVKPLIESNIIPDMTDHYPKYKDNLSTCRSPQGMMSAVVKEWYRDPKHAAGKRTVVVSIMPCTAKKMEARRPNSYTKGEPDTDIVITTTELIRMINNSGIDFAELDPEASDVPFGFGSGGGVIFGVTGGVTEAVLRRLIPEHDKVALDAIAECGVRGDDAIKEFSFEYEGQTLNICVVSGLINAKHVMEKVKRGEANYHLIEVMACRRGCIMGGGQPPRAGVRTKAARAKGIYSADNMSIIKKPDENPMVMSLYETLLKGKTHELLHNKEY